MNNILALENKEAKHKMAAIFFNIKKVYDKLNREKTLEKLKNREE